MKSAYIVQHMHCIFLCGKQYTLSIDAMEVPESGKDMIITVEEETNFAFNCKSLTFLKLIFILIGQLVFNRWSQKRLFDISFREDCASIG